MKKKTLLTLCNLAVALGGANFVHAQTTAFTYQGKLTDDCCPATGFYDLMFKVYDAPTAGTQLPLPIPVTVTTNRVPVTNGLFTVRLDFDASNSTVSAVFTGPRRWLQIEARSNSVAQSFVTLLPRTELTASPYALCAKKVGDGGVSATTLAPSPADGKVLTYNSGNLQWTTPSGGLTLPYRASISADNQGVFELYNTHANGAGLYGNGLAYGIRGEHGGGLNRGDLGTPTYGVFGFSQSGTAVRGDSPSGNAGVFMGNVGIGTSDPNARLHVAGSTAIFDYPSGAIRVRKSAGVSSVDDLGIWNPSGNGGEPLFAIADWETGTKGIFLNTSSGNVGIGTTVPRAGLEVASGGVAVTGATGYYGGTRGVYMEATPAGGSVFAYNYAAQSIHPDPLLLNPGGGNVGIGTTDPQAKLHVNGGVLGNAGVLGSGADGNGVVGLASIPIRNGVYGEHSGDGAGVGGRAKGPNGTGVYGISEQPTGWAGVFEGRVQVNGNMQVCTLTIVGGCDLAEPFQMSSEDIPNGALVVIDEDHPGQLKQATRAYDTRVAGIVSGANGIKPGIQLHQEGALEGGQNVALSGRVYALADASHGPIKPGDLLTSSDTPGHCMKATDSAKAQGAIIGKAMSALADGQGMVLVLVSLQ